MATEVEHLRRSSYKGGDEWSGQRTFRTTNAEAPSFQKSVEGEAFPDISGPGRPLARTSVAIYNARLGGTRMTGEALVIVAYETPRDPTRAKLTLKSFGLERKITQDRSAPPQIIDGPDDVDPRMSWKVVEGSNVGIQRVGLAVLSTAVDAASWVPRDVLAFMDTVNENPTPNILDAGPEELWMTDIRQTQEFGGTLVYVDFVMGYLPQPSDWAAAHPGETWRGWNSFTRSQLGSWIIQRIPVFDDLVDAGVWREIKVFKPDTKIEGNADDGFTLTEVPSEARVTKEVKDFSELEAREIFLIGAG